MTMTYRSAGTALTNAQIDSNIRTVENRYNGIPVASATTLTLADEYNYFVVTGSVTMIGLPDISAGFRVTLKFSGAPTLTHSSTFILPGGANITAAAGDVAVFQQEDTGTQVWRCVSYLYAANVLETYVTQADGDDTTKVATTAFADGQQELGGGWYYFGSASADTTDYITISGFKAEPKKIRVNFNKLVGGGTLNALHCSLSGGASYAATEAGINQKWGSTTSAWPVTGAKIIDSFSSSQAVSGYIEFTKYASNSYMVTGICFADIATEEVWETMGYVVLGAGDCDGLRFDCSVGIDSGSIDVWVMS